MERFCGILQRAIRSRRFPYASLDRFLTESVQLRQIANDKDAAAELALRIPSTQTGLSVQQCMEGSLYHVSTTCIDFIFSRSFLCALAPKSQAEAFGELYHKYRQCAGNAF
jgi:transaldolase